MKKKERHSGILLHLTSLPSKFGIGDLGPEAYAFADFLAKTRQHFWQVLPLAPTDPITCNSPYSSSSAFACNPLLISIERLVTVGLLTRKQIEPMSALTENRVDYDVVIRHKKNLLNAAYEQFEKNKKQAAYEQFLRENVHWLEDYALFVAVKERFHGAPWSDWSQELRDRDPAALAKMRQELRDRIEKERFFQYCFYDQWFSLKQYCNKKNVQIMGDIPIYVDFDSADVWMNPELFELDENREPAFVAGVPPDYFSATGQRWGNPLYRWDVLQETGYEWWFRRLSHTMKLFDLIRIDHFRGFVDFWKIPAEEETAVNGHWEEAPAEDFFNRVFERFPDIPIVAEDLGFITDKVRSVIDHFGFPGMRILLFAFGEDNPDHPYLPENFIENCVAYTGTHDNNTIRGWLTNEIAPEDKKRLFRCLGKKVPAKDVHWEMIRILMESVARLVVVPMQDILGLGQEARMNLPGTKVGNWEWRLVPGQVTPSVTEKLLSLTKETERV